MNDKLSTEELLKIAADSESAPIKNNFFEIHPQVEMFIKEFKIKIGEKKYPTFVIFYLYAVKYRPASAIKKLSKQRFFKQFSKLFVAKRTGKQRYYLLQELNGLTPEMVIKAEIYMRKEASNAKKKKKIIF